MTKRFGSVEAVKQLNLEVADQEFLVLLGPSGCGKTTALRMLAGLETASEGRILLGGRDITDRAPKDRDLAMVFQNYALYPHMSVFDNIAFSLRLRHTPRAELTRRVHEAADMLRLEDLLHRKPRELSGGQRQRVALGRAIVRRPAAFLMDEPLSNLDAKLRTGTRAELTKLHHDLQATFVYVTHDQVEAMTMATHIAVMADGSLQQVGTPTEVYDVPATTFVANFVGTPPMNLFPAELRREDGVLWAEAPGLRVPLEADINQAPTAVFLGVRPEHLQPAAEKAPGVAPSFEATVQAVEMLGNEVVLLTDVGGAACAIRAPRSFAAPPGAALRLTCAVEHIHLFHRGSGRRLVRHEEQTPRPPANVSVPRVLVGSSENRTLQPTAR